MFIFIANLFIALIGSLAGSGVYAPLAGPDATLLGMIVTGFVGAVLNRLAVEPLIRAHRDADARRTKREAGPL